MSVYDDFLERLSSALEDEQEREDFLCFLQSLTRDERAELLAEADGRERPAEIN